MPKTFIDWAVLIVVLMVLGAVFYGATLIADIAVARERVMAR